MVTRTLPLATIRCGQPGVPRRLRRWRRAAKPLAAGPWPQPPASPTTTDAPSAAPRLAPATSSAPSAAPPCNRAGTTKFTGLPTSLAHTDARCERVVLRHLQETSWLLRTSAASGGDASRQYIHCRRSRPTGERRTLSLRECTTGEAGSLDPGLTRGAGCHDRDRN